MAKQCLLVVKQKEQSNETMLPNWRGKAYKTNHQSFEILVLVWLTINRFLYNFKMNNLNKNSNEKHIIPN